MSKNTSVLPRGQLPPGAHGAAGHVGRAGHGHEEGAGYSEVLHSGKLYALKTEGYGFIEFEISNSTLFQQ